jgi:hypothetical protein
MEMWLTGERQRIEHPPGICPRLRKSFYLGDTYEAMCLHWHIEKTFPRDRRERIFLDKHQLHDIATAIETNQIPGLERLDKQVALQSLNNAIFWIMTHEKNSRKMIRYQAEYPCFEIMFQ